MRFRKKSSTSTSNSSSTTSSSSCSDSDSSSDSESSSTAEEKELPQSKTTTDEKSQVTTRRKSSEFRAAAAAANKAGEADKLTGATTTKARPLNVSAITQRQARTSTSTAGIDADAPPPSKKPTRPINVATTMPRRKVSASSASISATLKSAAAAAGGGGKAPPHKAVAAKQSIASNNNKQQTSAAAGVASTSNSAASGSVVKVDKIISGNFSPVGSDDSDIQMPPITGGKNERKVVSRSNSNIVNAKRNQSTRSRPQPKRNVPLNKSANNRAKSSGESESESGSDTVSGDETSSSSESEASNSSDSFNLPEINTKATKGKRAPTAAAIKLSRTDSDELNAESHEMTTRQLTRSLSTRRNKQMVKSGGLGVGGSDTDSGDGDDEKRSLSKSPAKKYNSVTSKSKVKRECNTIDLHPKAPRSISPLQQLEKKCPIEGCDSSGHLSGNLDRHFLPEACPIYHNMSASECKERANERRLRDEERQKTAANSSNNTSSSTLNLENVGVKVLTTEQKEFLAKIRESRALFRPITATVNTDKVKLEKDCTDEDREPSLNGLVPDYDLQLFREAQALASERIEDELKDLPVGKGIKYITMGKYKMKVWYQSPYPDDAARLPKMYICEFCLRYQKSETGIKRHAQKCVWRHPPGDEIYRKGKLQVWQVDGKRHKQYCQHLCLLAKFFLDHKTLYYDVEPFLFYIMTLADVDGCHTVGYFSKEKNSFYNVSCILTLPPYQRKGYGRLLIDFSYLLTRVEGKIGSPEKPLSDLGLISYRSYWKDVLLDYLCNRSGNTLSIKDVSQEMAIYSYDIVSTLQALGMMKYWKGKHIVLKKQDVLDEYEERVKRRGNFPKIDDTCLRWRPFVPTQTNNTA